MMENSNPTLPSTPTADAPTPATVPARKKGGRPKGSKNKKPPVPKKAVVPRKKKAKRAPKNKSVAHKSHSLTQLRNRAFLNEVRPALLSVFQSSQFNNFADFYTAFYTAYPSYGMGESLFKSLCRSAGIRMAHMLVGPDPIIGVRSATFPTTRTSAPSNEEDVDEDEEDLGGVDGTRHLVET